MGRPVGVELGGGLYRATCCGGRRDDIVVDDADRKKWLALLGEVCERFNWRYRVCRLPPDRQSLPHRGGNDGRQAKTR